MSINDRVIQLQRSILDAKSELIPNFGDANQSQIKGYILLVHAEFESFIEDIGTTTTEKALEIWIQESKASIALSYLALFFSYNIKNGDFTNRLYKCVKTYKDAVRGNNGIKSENIERILGRIGINLDLIDSTVEGDLNAFGSKRGEIAHSSIGKITFSLNALDVINSVENITTALSKIEAEIVRVLS